MTVSEISVAEAQVLLGGANPPRLIDVREEDEWAQCRIPGAELMPLSDFARGAAEKLTDHEQPLLIYCHHGVRSARAAEYLLQQGFTDVTNLAGGIDAWAVEVDPGIGRY